MRTRKRVQKVLVVVVVVVVMVVIVVLRCVLLLLVDLLVVLLDSQSDLSGSDSLSDVGKGLAFAFESSSLPLRGLRSLSRAALDVLGSSLSFLVRCLLLVDVFACLASFASFSFVCWAKKAAS